MLSDICMSMRNKESRCDFFSGRNIHWYHDSHKRDILLSNEKIHDIVDTSSARERKRERSRGVMGTRKSQRYDGSSGEILTRTTETERQNGKRERREKETYRASRIREKKIFANLYMELCWKVYSTRLRIRSFHWIEGNMMGGERLRRHNYDINTES